MSGNQIQKKKGGSLVATWDDAVHDILTQNVRLQGKALHVIESKIEEANAYQAALIYGILHDKCQQIVAPKAGEGNTFNMYMGSAIPDEQASALIDKVLKRAMQEENIVDADVVEISEADADE
mgnify:CR=1 FL=1